MKRNSSLLKEKDGGQDTLRQIIELLTYWEVKLALTDILDIIAIIISPIVAVIISQHLQERERMHLDKMDVFKTLMVSRGMSWTPEKVKALNIIEVVFYNDNKVLNQWKTYYESLCNDNPNNEELSKIKAEGDRLLDTMAASLGYKDKVTWDTIQNPYIPKGLSENLSQQQQYQEAQLSAMKTIGAYIQQTNMNEGKSCNCSKNEINCTNNC